MNKEVIYLEPEDDITDILTKLQQAEQKLVALVPPKKATILRSAVNMKLVARVAKECEKVAVIVTADPAIIKMAMAAKIPVAKNLQSRPVVPTEETLKKTEQKEQIIDEDTLDEPENGKKAKIAPEASNSLPNASKDESANDITIDEDSLENASRKSEKAKTKKKTQKTPSNENFFQKYRKYILFGSVAAVVLAVVLVWAFVFAPSATITVAVSSTPSNFSETVRFTEDPNAENLEEGIFFAEKQILEEKYSTSFEVTDEKDMGEKAQGMLAVTYTMSLSEYLGKGFNIGINVGDTFTTTTGLSYIATEDTDRVKWDGAGFNLVCNSPVTSINDRCVKTFRFNVEAVEAGEKYNITSSVTWNPFEGAPVSSAGSIIGGTTKMEKVVSEDDLNKIKEAQLAEHSTEGREHLFEDLSKDIVPIESSFKGEAKNIESTPAVGETVSGDNKAEARIVAEYSVYVVSLSKIEEYIKLKTTVADDQKIYSIGEPYFERFTGIDETARLKTTIETGPTVTEDDIFEKAKGRKTGEVQSILKSINGVSTVEIRAPYFWVWSIPNDRSKVTINLMGEGQE